MAGCCANDDISLYASLRQRNICPYATPVRQQKTVLCAGISGVMYMDSSLAHLPVWNPRRFPEIFGRDPAF